MVIKKEKSIKKIIEKGGDITSKNKEETKPERVQMHLSIPKKIADKIDKLRREKNYYIPRTVFIIRAIEKEIESEINKKYIK